MADLSHLIAAILKEVEKAQDQSNLYTRQLAAKYRNDKIMRNLPVPNALLTELDFEFNFVLDDEDIDPQSFEKQVLEPTFNLFYKPFKTITAKVLKHICNFLQDKIDLNKTDHEKDKLIKIIASLKSEKIENKVAKNVTQYSYDDLVAIFKQPDKQPSRREISDLVMNSYKEFLFNDPDLSKMLKGIEEKSILDTISDLLKEFVHEIEEAYRDFNKSELERPLNIVTESKRLSNLPIENLNKLRIRLRLEGYKWIVLEDGKEILQPEE